jgi:Fe-S-cluster containining protein
MHEEAPVTATPYDCQVCGACCAAVPSAATAYVRLFDIDLARLRGSDVPIYREENRWTDWTEEVLQLGIKMNEQGKRVCVAFDGEVGGRCGCALYSQRPEACRKFEAGSTLCKEARQAAGLPL